MYLKMRYGDVVEVSYVDLSDPTNQERFAELVGVVDERDLGYPLVAVNGEIRLVGSAHYYHILPLVEEALAARPT
jgi:disulfide oxidoreductase YuzD